MSDQIRKKRELDSCFLYLYYLLNAVIVAMCERSAIRRPCFRMQCKGGRGRQDKEVRRCVCSVEVVLLWHDCGNEEQE